MSAKLLTEQHFEFLSLKEGSTGSSESTLVIMPHCWKSQVTALIFFFSGNGKRSSPSTDNLENLQRNKQFILGQLLLKNRLPVTEVISNYPEQADLLESDNIYPESDDDSVRQRLLEKMSSLLSDMVSLNEFTTLCYGKLK